MKVLAEVVKTLTKEKLTFKVRSSDLVRH